MIPLIVSKPDPMSKIRVIVIKDDVEKTLKVLQEIGTLHIEKSEELSPVDRAIIERGRRSTEELLSFVNDMLSYIPQGEVKNEALEDDITVMYTRPFSELEKEVNKLYTSLSDLHQKTVAFNEEIKQLDGLKKYLGSLFGTANLRLRDLNFSGKHLSSRTMVISHETYEGIIGRLKQYILTYTITHVEDEAVLYVVTHTENLKTIASLVMESGGRMLNIPSDDVSLEEFLNVTDKRLRSLEAEATKLRIVLHDKVKENLKNLILMRGALIAEHERFTVLEKASQAKYLALIEGWLPETKFDVAATGIKDIVEHVYVDTRTPEKTEEPPTKQTNMGGVSPFEVILGLFGVPNYREWDPTAIMAYSFAIFYSFMNGDVIYGIGLILVVRFLLAKLSGNPGTSIGFKQFQGVLYICGIFGIISGLLQGAYLGDIYKFFGINSLALSKSVESVTSNPVMYIVVALVVGTIHVNIAHVFGFIKAIKQKAISPILNKLGIFTLQIFGIPYIMQMIMKISVPGFTNDIMMRGLAVSIILLMASTIISSKIFGVFLWLFDLTGILGDIMSYCRLAGVGLASFYLASMINMIAKLLSSMMGRFIPGIAGAIIGGIVLIAILIGGHLLSLFLGVLGGFIHSMRLCFVEFLLKFYDGTGRAYSPFKLRNKTSALIAEKSL